MNNPHSPTKKAATSAIVVALLALGACSSSSKSSSTTTPVVEAPATSPAGGANSTPAAANVLTIQNMTFSALTVKAGDPISIVNADSTDHTVTADDGSFDVQVAAGQTMTLTIDNPGTFAIHCKIHSSMHGSITVT